MKKTESCENNLMVNQMSVFKFLFLRFFRGSQTFKDVIKLTQVFKHSDDLFPSIRQRFNELIKLILFKSYCNNLNENDNFPYY